MGAEIRYYATIRLISTNHPIINLRIFAARHLTVLSFKSKSSFWDIILILLSLSVFSGLISALIGFNVLCKFLAHCEILKF
jgi:hypothetical protein